MKEVCNQNDQFVSFFSSIIAFALFNCRHIPKIELFLKSYWIENMRKKMN